MLDLIRRFLMRVGLLATSRSRRCAAAHSPQPTSGVPFPEWAPLPAHRSPYGLDPTLDGITTVSVRPYLVAHEQRQRCRELNSPTPTLPAAGPYWSAGVEAA